MSESLPEQESIRLAKRLAEQEQCSRREAELHIVAGNVQVDGNIDASGSIMDAGGNSNHHSH